MPNHEQILRKLDHDLPVGVTRGNLSNIAREMYRAGLPMESCERVWKRYIKARESLPHAQAKGFLRMDVGTQGAEILASAQAAVVEKRKWKKDVLLRVLDSGKPVEGRLTVNKARAIVGGKLPRPPGSFTAFHLACHGYVLKRKLIPMGQRIDKQASRLSCSQCVRTNDYRTLKHVALNHIHHHQKLLAFARKVQQQRQKAKKPAERTAWLRAFERAYEEVVNSHFRNTARLSNRNKKLRELSKQAGVVFEPIMQHSLGTLLAIHERGGRLTQAQRERVSKHLDKSLRAEKRSDKPTPEAAQTKAEEMVILDSPLRKRVFRYLDANVDAIVNFGGEAFAWSGGVVLEFEEFLAQYRAPLAGRYLAVFTKNLEFFRSQLNGSNGEHTGTDGLACWVRDEMHYRHTTDVFDMEFAGGFSDALSNCGDMCDIEDHPMREKPSHLWLVSTHVPDARASKACVSHGHMDFGLFRSSAFGSVTTARIQISRGMRLVAPQWWESCFVTKPKAVPDYGYLFTIFAMLDGASDVAHVINLCLGAPGSLFSCLRFARKHDFKVSMYVSKQDENRSECKHAVRILDRWHKSRLQLQIEGIEPNPGPPDRKTKRVTKHEAMAQHAHQMAEDAAALKDAVADAKAESFEKIVEKKKIPVSDDLTSGRDVSMHLRFFSNDPFGLNSVINPSRVTTTVRSSVAHETFMGFLRGWKHDNLTQACVGTTLGIQYSLSVVALTRSSQFGALGVAELFPAIGFGLVASASLCGHYVVETLRHACSTLREAYLHATADRDKILASNGLHEFEATLRGTAAENNPAEDQRLPRDRSTPLAYNPSGAMLRVVRRTHHKRSWIRGILTGDSSRVTEVVLCDTTIDARWALNNYRWMPEAKTSVQVSCGQAATDASGNRHEMSPKELGPLQWLYTMLHGHDSSIGQGNACPVADPACSLGTASGTMH